MEDSVQQTILRLESLCEEAIKDRSNLNELFQSARPRLLRIINLRSPPQLNQRVDSEDVLQETFVRATQRFNEFANERRVPVFVWLRGLALERLVEFKRQHLGAAKRDLGREVSMRQWLNETSLEMTRRWAMNAKSPSQIVSDRQRSEDLKRALEWLPENYREVLVLRFFESLSVAETAVALDCSIANAKVLQFRALKKLNQILRDKIGWDSADRQEDSQ